MSPELPDFIPRKLVYRPSEVARYLGLSVRQVQRKMKKGVFGKLKRAGGGDERPFYKITYDGLLHYYQEREKPQRLGHEPKSQTEADVNSLPGALKEIADAVGEEQAFRVGECLANRTVKFPTLHTLRRRARDQAIIRDYQQGASIAALAARYCLTPRRIRQITSKI